MAQYMPISGYMYLPSSRKVNARCVGAPPAACRRKPHLNGARRLRITSGSSVPRASSSVFFFSATSFKSLGAGNGKSGVWSAVALAEMGGRPTGEVENKISDDMPQVAPV